MDNGQWTTASCNLSPEGNAWKENKLEYFENKKQEILDKEEAIKKKK